MARTGIKYICLALCHLLVVTDVIASDGELSGDYQEYFDPVAYQRIFDYQVRWKITDFAGSPAVNVKFKWQMRRNSVVAIKPKTFYASDIPEDILATVKPYNLEVKLCGVGFCFKYDPGEPASSGTVWGGNSSNVLDWNRLFYEGSTHLGAEEAKNIVKQGAKFTHVEITRLDWATYDLDSWLHEEYPLKEIATLKKAIHRQLGNIKKNQNLDVQQIKDSLERFEKQNKPRVVKDKFLSVLEKLSIDGLPSRFRDKATEKQYLSEQSKLKTADDQEIIEASKPPERDIKHEQWVAAKEKEKNKPENKKAVELFAHQSNIVERIMEFDRVKQGAIKDACGKISRYASERQGTKWVECSNKFEAEMLKLERELTMLREEADKTGVLNEVEEVIRFKESSVQVAIEGIEDEFQKLLKSMDRHDDRQLRRARLREEKKLRELEASARHNAQNQTWHQPNISNGHWGSEYQNYSVPQTNKMYNKATFSYPEPGDHNKNSSSRNDVLIIDNGELCAQFGLSGAEREACEARNRQNMPEKQRNDYVGTKAKTQ